MLAQFFFPLIIGIVSILSVEAFTSAEVKCHVCKATVQEMEHAILQVDPKKMTDVNGFRLDAAGNFKSKTVPLVKSEMFLTELMENICEKLEDYVKVTYKKSGKFALLRMVVDGKMNPETSKVDFVQDGDLNKSLAHFCLEILDDFELEFLKYFQAENMAEDLDNKICGESTKLCPAAPMHEDYEFDEFKDEL